MDSGGPGGRDRKVISKLGGNVADDGLRGL